MSLDFVFPEQAPIEMVYCTVHMKSMRDVAWLILIKQDLKTVSNMEDILSTMKDICTWRAKWLMA